MLLDLVSLIKRKWRDGAPSPHYVEWDGEIMVFSSAEAAAAFLAEKEGEAV